MRTVWFMCHASALLAIVYAGITGARWPIGFASCMLVAGLIAFAGRKLED